MLTTVDSALARFAATQTQGHTTQTEQTTRTEGLATSTQTTPSIEFRRRWSADLGRVGGVYWRQLGSGWWRSLGSSRVVR